MFLLRNSSGETPRQTYEELKRKRVKIPFLLDELSAIYLISILREYLENDN